MEYQGAPADGSYHAQDGQGGRGGWGGQGGQGGQAHNGMAGKLGEPGGPGEPGEPGRRSAAFSIPAATWVTLVLAATAGAWWLFGVDSKVDKNQISSESKISEVARDLADFKSNVLSLNTPLSQRVFSAEARTGEVARIQTEVRAQLADVIANGTNPNKLLRREVDLMRAELAGANARCQSLTTRVDALQSDVLENKIRIQNVVEALTPHDARGKK